MRPTLLSRASLVLLVMLCAATVAGVLVVRLAVGPADLYEKDQPKTLSYTADMLIHGRWALPRDVIYQPATKPPLYNWVAAVVMKLTGSWGELAMKSPSVIGALGVGAILVYLGAGASSPREVRSDGEKLGPGTGRLSSRGAGAAVGALACAIWFAYGVEPRHASVIRLLFLARPDMLQAFFLTGAWAAATLALMRRVDDVPSIDDDAAPPIDRPSFLSHAAVFWLCVTGAILTKGPLAALAILYPFVVAPLIATRYRDVRRLRPVVGALAMLLVSGAWLALAYRTDPAHVRGVMLGAELVERITERTPEGLHKALWLTPMWFVTKGGPFSMVALVAIAVVVAARLARLAVDGVVVGAAVWVVVLIVGLSVPAGKRMDYLLPSFAPAAYLAAWLIVSACRAARVPVAVAGLAPLVMAVVLCRAHLTRFIESRAPHSGKLVDFAEKVRARARDDERLLVLIRGKHPLPVLLHRHQGSLLTLDDLRSARWVVLPTFDTAASPVEVSARVPFGFKTFETKDLARMGLYDMRAEPRPTIDELVRAQRAISIFSVEENPYHSPGTGWRDTPETAALGRQPSNAPRFTTD